MIKALSAAATGLQAQQSSIERIAHDMANVNTDAYKKGRTEFQDLLYQTQKQPGQSLGNQTVSPVGVQTGMGVKVGASHKIFEQGPAKMTGQPFDVMIEGPGFFSVQLPNGEVGFTRNGAFKRDATGKFMLSGGQKLIPEITIPQNSLGVTINPDGQVRSMQADGNEAVIGNITLVNFANEEGLLSSGNGVYKSTIASGPPLPGQPGSIGYGNLTAGALEGSNVDVATSMVDMIQTQRAYELNTKVMGVADQMMNATVNIKQ